MVYQVHSSTDGRNAGRIFTVLPAIGDVIILDFNFSIQVADRIHRPDGSVVIGNANYILILSPTTTS